MSNVWYSLDGMLASGKDLLLEIGVRKSKRTIEQNKRLWKIYQILAENACVDGKRFDSETWHEFLKRKFIGCNELPDGSLFGISTTTLNTAEMVEYQDKIQSWATEEFGIVWEI